MEKKKCHLHVTSPITCFSVPIVGDTELFLTTDEIFKCICTGAEVSEVLPGGERVRLNFSNYNRNNSIIGEPKEEEIIVEEPVTVGHITEEEPAIEAAETIATEPVEEVVEESVDVEIEQVEEATEEVVEEVESTEEDTVKDYQVESRNKNKKNKNKK